LSPDAEKSRRVVERFASSSAYASAAKSSAAAFVELHQEGIMKRILALVFAAGMIVALAPTDADAQRGGRGGGGMGGGTFAGGMGGGGFPGGMGGGGNWAGMGGGGMGGMGGMGGGWAGGGNWRPGWGWGAAGAAAALGAATYPWGYGYDTYASETDPCLQQRTVRRGGAYRTVWVNVC
jgi:hypothetical protein